MNKYASGWNYLYRSFLFFFISISTCLSAQKKEHICFVNDFDAVTISTAMSNTAPCDGNDVATLYLNDIKNVFEIRAQNYKILNTPLKTAWSYLSEINGNLIQTLAINRIYFENLFTSAEDKKAILIYVIAHEYAHCMNGDAMYAPDYSLYTNYNKEILADDRAGYAVARLTNVGIEFFDNLSRVLNKKDFSKTHPEVKYRILVAKCGWIEGKLKDSRNEDTLSTFSGQLVKNIEAQDRKFECRNSKGKLNEIVKFQSRDNNLVFIKYINGNEDKALAAYIYSDSTGPQLFLGQYQSFDSGKVDGLQVLPNNEWFKGSATTSYSNAKGEQHHSNGDLYHGELMDTDEKGWGRMDYKDGSSYIGEWKGAKRDGHGVYYKGKVLINQGIWRDDKFCPDCKE